MKAKELFDNLKKMDPKVPLKMPKYTIHDFHQFVDSHYAFLNGQPGNKRYQPYYIRLLEVYTTIKTKVDE